MGTLSIVFSHPKTGMSQVFIKTVEGILEICTFSKYSHFNNMWKSKLNFQGVFVSVDLSNSYFRYFIMAYNSFIVYIILNEG